MMTETYWDVLDQLVVKTEQRNEYLSKQRAVQAQIDAGNEDDSLLEKDIALQAEINRLDDDREELNEKAIRLMLLA